MEIVRKLDPERSEIDAVLGILSAHSEAIRPGDYKSIGFILHDDDGAIVGGLTGYSLYDWLFVQFLAVDETLRGQGYGRKLMNEAEAWARETGLLGMWLDTFELQAPEFYKKLGYSVFGTIEDHPLGSRRYFLQKRFESEAPTA